MRIKGFELVRVAMPLREPFRTSFGVEHERDVLLVRADTPGAPGWGECVALDQPVYNAEYVDGAADVIRRFFAPALLSAGHLDPRRVAGLLASFKGHRMAKAALEMAVLDAWLRERDESFAAHLGAVHESVPAGVSVGLTDTIAQLLEAVESFVALGYTRVKLKIEPGWDVEPVRAVRERFGVDLALQVDANAAYTLADAGVLTRLDEFGLQLIEQPVAGGDLRQHAELAALLRTPICLDESIESAKDAADAIALGACRIVNIKAGRVGGYLEARRIHDLCAAHGVAVWCGGMLETGLGRAANIALAALPGFVLPGDTSASDRYYQQDLTRPFVLEDGHVAVPSGPGLGVEPLADVLSSRTTATEWLSA
ncbi:MAG: o-succinylbenzoate synthase [bacterium]